MKKRIISKRFRLSLWVSIDMKINLPKNKKNERIMIPDAKKKI
jgi:hypothetical protein